MRPQILFKDPDVSRNYSFDWSTDLNAGAVVQGTNEWSATPAGLDIDEETIDPDGLITTARIGGGEAGETYIVTNRVTTSDGETLEESGRLRVKESSTL